MRVLLNTAGNDNLKRFDVKMTYLYRKLKENFFIQQLEEFSDKILDV
jgi:hypothetical protein